MPCVDLPLLDDVIDSVHWLGLLQVLGQTPLSTADSFRQLLCKRLVFPQLAQDWLMEQVLDVLGVVEGSGR